MIWFYSWSYIFLSDVLRPVHVTAMSESHSGFWVDWQFPVDKQGVLEKFVVVCSDCLSFRNNRTTTFDVAKELRCLPVNYIPEIPYAYVKVVPIAMQSKFLIHKTFHMLGFKVRLYTFTITSNLSIEVITKIHVTKTFKEIPCLHTLGLGILR